MQKNILLPIIVIVGVIIIGGAAWWYFQDGEINIPLISTPGISQEKDIAATLAYQQGDVQVKIGDGDWQIVETDAVLHQGDSIKAGTDSKAIIELETGDIFRLGYDTEIFFTSLTNHDLIISQVNGASYHRVVKDSFKLYQVKTAEVTVQSRGTAFDVIETDVQVDVACLQSKVNILTDEDEGEIDEGKKANINKNEKKVNINDIDKEDLTNDWYTWNKEEDSKKTDKLGVMQDLAGPKLIITKPEDKDTTTENGMIVVEGTVNDFAAKLFVNDEEVENKAGQFSKEISLVPGKNVITVIAEDVNGYRTIQEVKVIYQTVASATPVTLVAETKTDGVYLSWNESTGATFQYYKVVRSETNADLIYPDDGYITMKNKGEESYTDTEAAIDKTYYYRVCEVMLGEEVFCSNVVYMKGKIAEPPADTVTQPTSGSGISLSATAENDGVHLSWTVTNLNVEHGFKIVKGTIASPVFPGNDYRYLSDSTTRSYTWALTDGQTYYFRVCQYNGEGKCLVYSNNVKITAKELTFEDIGLIMSAKAEASGVGLWWTDVSNISGFKYYKVVRSETNADLKYPDDGYIAVKSKGQESHRDYSAVKGKTYYYRICAVGNLIFCSNVVQVTAIHDNAAPSAVSLSATYANDSVTLNWTASAENDFKYYKVVWSQTDSSPTYPKDGYLAVITKASITSYVDDGQASNSRQTSVCFSCQTHYYSVCVVDLQDQVTCSNTKTVSGGQVL